MEVCEEKDVHPQRTTRTNLSYCFTPKHHGGGARSDSRWLPDLAPAEEFAVFDMADANEFSDDDGNLYGLRIRRTGGTREILPLGVWHELIARFWHEEPRMHWHGHPLWPVGESGPENRRKPKNCPPNSVFDRMVKVGVLRPIHVGRLKTGRHLRNLPGV